MAAPPITRLEDRYRRLKKERGPEKPRGWPADEIAVEFVDAVEAFEPRMVGTGPFYPDGGRELLPPTTGVLRKPTLAGTNDLAALLAARPRFKVDRRPLLDFHYVDREIVASRALDARTGKPHFQASPVQLDFLLVNADDGTPIASEAKLTNDPKDPEAALLQALMYASLLAPSGQRKRLPENYPDLFRAVPERVDVYVLLYKLPKRRDGLLKSAIALAQDLGTDASVGRYLRRIAFIEAYVKNDALRFRALARPVELASAS